MSINWTQYKNEGSSYNRPVEKTWTTHEGLVVGAEFTRCERVMSDVYADVSYCRVWNPTTKTVKTVTLGTHFELCFKYGNAEVDAPAHILKAVELQEEVAQQAAQQVHQERLEREAREAALHDWHIPQRGMLMQVVRGCKVKKGTIGRVFWLDDFRSPTRVGLATSQVKVNGRYRDVAWVDAAYLQNMKPHPEYEVT